MPRRKIELRRLKRVYGPLKSAEREQRNTRECRALEKSPAARTKLGNRLTKALGSFL